MKKTILCMGFLWASQLLALTCSTPVTVSEGDRGNFSRTAINDKGDAAILWVTRDKDNYLLSSAMRSAGQEWSAPELVPEDQPVCCSLLSLDEEGNLYALYHAKGAGKAHFHFAKKEKTGAWSSPADFYDLEEGLESPVHMLDPRGNALVLGSMPEDPSKDIFSKVNPWIASYQHQSGQKASEKLYQPSEYSVFKTASINPQGAGMVLWMTNQGRGFFNPTVQTVVEGIWFQDGKAVSSPVTLCDIQKGYPVRHENFDVSTNASKGIATIWQEFEDKRIAIQAVVCLDGKSAEPFELFAQEHVSPPKIVIDQDNNALAVWGAVQGIKPPAAVIFAAYKPAGQPWGSPVALSDPMKLSRSFLVKAAAPGKFVVIWDEMTKDHGDIHGAVFSTAAQTWSSALLSPPGVRALFPSAAFNAKGQGIISWTIFHERSIYVQTADLSLD
jgi:hypothetical protein